MSGERTYSIGTLAEAAGVSRRTVRFYVQRDLLPPPDGLGRGAHYGDEHLARLLQVKAWQEEGVPLDEIRVRLRHEHPASAPLRAERDTGWRVGEAVSPYRQGATPRPQVVFAPGQPWFRQPLVSGYELHVAGGRQPLTARQLASLASALSEIIENGGLSK
jgi:DNA-binding transcriptional MerR regulator